MIPSALGYLTVVVAASLFGRVFTVGSAVVAFVLLAIGARLLYRGKQASSAIENANASAKLANDWRDNYLAERQAREDAMKEAVEQRELKHAALTELAAAKMATDLSAVMTALIELQKTATAQTSILGRIAETLNRHERSPL